MKSKTHNEQFQHNFTNKNSLPNNKSFVHKPIKLNVTRRTQSHFNCTNGATKNNNNFT